MLEERLVPQTASTQSPNEDVSRQGEKIETLNKFSFLSYMFPKASFRYAVEPTSNIEPVFVKERNFRYSPVTQS